MFTLKQSFACSKIISQTREIANFCKFDQLSPPPNVNTRFVPLLVSSCRKRQLILDSTHGHAEVSDLSAVSRNLFPIEFVSYAFLQADLVAEEEAETINIKCSAVYRFDVE